MSNQTTLDADLQPNTEHVHHCNQCEHKTFEMSVGTKCGITGAKPLFHERCRDIKFGETQRDVLIAAKYDMAVIDANRANFMGNFIMYVTLGIAVIVTGFFVHNWLWDLGFISTLTIIIVGIGLALVSMGGRLLYTYKTKKSIAADKLAKVESVLQLYGIEYDLDLKMTKDRHGNYEISPELEFR